MKKRILTIIAVMMVAVCISGCMTTSVFNALFSSSSSSQGQSSSYSPFDYSRSDNSGSDIYSETNNEDFDKYCEEIFAKTYESSAFDSHFVMYDPSNYGIEYDEEDYIIGSISYDSLVNDNEDTESELNELHRFDRESLSKEQQITYDTLEKYLLNQQEYVGLEKYYNYFEPRNGVVANLQINFTEYTFHGEDDVKHYLLFLKDSERFLNEGVTYIKDRYDAGMFMSDKAADIVIENCETIINADPDPMVESFNDKIDALDIDADKADEYKALNEEYVEKYYKAGMAAVKECVEGLKGNPLYSENVGLCAYGEEALKYYEALFHDQTSSSMSVEEGIDLLEEQMDTLMEQFTYYIMYTEAGTEYFEYSVPMTDPVEIIDFLMDNYEADLPTAYTLDYTVDYLDPACEIENVVAYYMPAPIDNITINSIKINASQIDDTKTLYHALAHEGFPGHMYQFDSFYGNEKFCDLRKILNFIGASEGWAEYAADIAYNYLDCSEGLKEALKLDNLLGYILIARIDIGVNYEGWTVSDVADYMTEKGFESSYAEYYYDEVIYSPGTYFPYSIGHIMLNELKNRAYNELGDRFSVKAFNSWIIEDMGITHFDIYYDHFDEWLNSQLIV